MSSTIFDKEKHKMLKVDIPASQSFNLSLPNTAQTSRKQTPPTAAKYNISAPLIIPIWIVLSSSVIMYNNYLYNTRKFKFPVFLVTCHLGFATAGTRILQRTTNL